MRKGVQKIYAEVAPTYELVNHVLTFGFDIFWRRRAARIAVKTRGRYILDVCSGTGEMAQAVASQINNDTQIICVDFSLAMLLEAEKKKGLEKTRFVMAEVGTLPFPDNTFDVALISFATRNLNIKRHVLNNNSFRI